MADEDTPQEPASEPEQQTPEQPETGQPVAADKTVPLADLVKERKERQRLAKEVEALRTANLSETEKAIAEAEKRGEGSALKRVGTRLVDAEVRAVASGRFEKEQVAALLDGLDRSRFLTEDGEVDETAVAAWIDRVAPASSPRRFGDVDQGVRGSTTKGSDDQDPATLAAAALAQRGY